MRSASAFIVCCNRRQIADRYPLAHHRSNDSWYSIVLVGVAILYALPKNSRHSVRSAQTLPKAHLHGNQESVLSNDMVDHRYRKYRVPVRYLRIADDAACGATSNRRAVGRSAKSSLGQSLDWEIALDYSLVRWCVWINWWRFDRSTGPQVCDGGEHLRLLAITILGRV